MEKREKDVEEKMRASMVDGGGRGGDDDASSLVLAYRNGREREGMQLGISKGK
jgi:hypothetical protein